MGIFKDLISRHLLDRPTPPSPRPVRCHGIGEALPCCCAAAVTASGEKNVNQKRVLPPNHPDFIRVQRMAGDVITAACDDANYGRRGLSPTIRRPFRGIKWTVDVIDARYVNAFATHTGSIYVTTGLLKYLRYDDAVAAVLAHEVAHVISRHIEETKRRWVMSSFLANFAAELLNAPPGDKATRESWRSLFMRPWYYRQEYEADHLGLILLAAAGYDPRAGPWTYWKFGEIGELAPDDLRSSHPPSAKRVERLSRGKIMDEAMTLFLNADRPGNF
ncbi:unnamed protein product [Urochloa decumbens]|uniref:Peptidase M48 domain-containing protein n=1 Tax=Urochloa decumbens TaxID=240449 RepID=A0ABC9C6I7_9POAL